VLEADEWPVTGKISLQNHSFDVEKDVEDARPLAPRTIASLSGGVKSAGLRA